MGPKQFTEKIIVATSQFIRNDLTRDLFLSLESDGVPFTSLVLFDGTPKEKISLQNVDIAIIVEKPIHSMPEIFNIIFNLAKSTDAEFIMFCDNDIKFKKGSFQRLSVLTKSYDVISPLKIDKDLEKFKSYFSTEAPVEVIGSNDSVWFFRLNKIPWSPEDRIGPFGFEDVIINYKLWRNGATFVVDPKAVVFHHGSQETSDCFLPADRERYSGEWDSKRDRFLKDNGSEGKWFFDNVIMNQEGIKRFGYPVFVLEKEG